MIKRLFLVATLGTLLSGCYMIPMAFVGPAISGFSTASITQSAFTTGAGYMVKKTTGKTISEHAINSLVGDAIKQSYFPEERENATTRIVPKPKSIK